ncbi:hypothetical protein D9M68_601150 [compost metagenome]
MWTFGQGEVVLGIADLQGFATAQLFVDESGTTATFRVFSDRDDIAVSLCRIVEQGIASERNAFNDDVDVRACGEWRKLSCITGSELIGENVVSLMRDGFDIHLVSVRLVHN